ncbi:MAG: hypothetical protein ABI353_17860 [Isosphaeraceae bacterium]
MGLKINLGLHLSYDADQPRPRGRLLLIPGRLVHLESPTMPAASVRLEIPSGFGQAIRLEPSFHGRAATIDGRPTATFADEGFELLPDPAAPDDPLACIIACRAPVGTSTTGVLTADARIGEGVQDLTLALEVLSVPTEADALGVSPGRIVDLDAAAVPEPVTSG